MRLGTLGCLALSLMVIAESGQAEIKTANRLTGASQIEIPKEEVIETEQPDPVRYSLSYEERVAVEQTVMAEAGSEDFTGQVLIAQCLLNSAEKQGISPAKVIRVNQYATTHIPASEDVQRAVSAVFDDGYYYIDAPIEVFYAPALVDSEWHESQRFVIEYGGHRFFEMEGK